MQSPAHVLNALTELTELLDKTGSVGVPLALVAAGLAYGVGYRVAVVAGFDLGAVQELARAGSQQRAEETAFLLRQDIARFCTLNDTLVGLAPLLGLLGTVIGMIETFASLGDGVLLSATGGGIAGGISEALFSTQVGLMIAVPGLLSGRMLDRRRDALELRIERALALADPVHHGQHARDVRDVRDAHDEQVAS